MEDTDLMPFGKHKGTAMANVPAPYLIWLGENAKTGVRTSFPQVFEYIDDCKNVLQKEVEK